MLAFLESVIEGDVAGKFRLWKMLQEPQPNCYVLGIYPQPPFLLHTPDPKDAEEAFESIRHIMSAVDGVNYPKWIPRELEPFPAS